MGSQLGPGDRVPGVSSHHVFPGPRRGVPRATQHIPRMDPATAPRLTNAEIQAWAAQEALALAQGLAKGAGKGDGGGK
eukprot:2232588-Alexandrium_andersonii.AAC.1